MLALMFFVSIQSSPQLAEELQSKPPNSEIRELLKLLSKPNLKVRTRRTCKTPKLPLDVFASMAADTSPWREAVVEKDVLFMHSL
ncbi:hypothetical protein NDU88_005216 [Pleurodeles waltl]|uniref:Uncharacterized protein n=1 Tax=Pleurodeles waltl TaxID=8319 RepID=A0AAV7MDY5_PLEWA|nr:hypothetical protein NDU88_005216 [Pleurodeles waltl]